MEQSKEDIVKIIEDARLGNIVFNMDISRLSSIKAGGKAFCYFRADGIRDLKRMIEICRENKIPFMIIGDCTNILFNDDYIDIALIKLGTGFNYIKFKKGEEITAGAACNLSRLIIKASGSGYDFSELSGIPGTLGGSITGNSGSVNTGICNFVKSISYITENNGEIAEITSSLNRNNFSYRKLEVPGLIALTGATLRAEKAGKSDILKRVRARIKKRKLTQPINARSLGCFFKNAKDSSGSAGELIEKCGFKGFQYGGARVSEKHANFIENFRNASSHDIFVLSKIIKDRVMDKYGVKLEYEVKLAGF
jgi:UDP-N-acetylmuramate dehydrogenase